MILPGLVIAGACLTAAVCLDRRNMATDRPE